MKKGLLKSLLCFALAGTLLFGDAGLTLAAVSNDVQPATQTQQVKANVASVDSLDITVNNSGSIYYSFSGYGSKFEIFVNGVKVDDHTKYNSREIYDSATNSFVYEEAPSYYDWGYLEIGAQPGATYEVKVVPYTFSGAMGTAKSASDKLDFNAIESIDSYVAESPVYKTEHETTGYTEFKGIYGYIYPTSYSSIGGRYEVWRSTKKSSGYEKVAIAYGTYGAYWSDETAKQGTKYYYKARPVAVVDTYVKTQVNGGWSEVIEVVAGEPNASGVSAFYMEEGVYVYCYETELVSGIEVYRSAKKSKGYKKIATTADMYYVDTTVKNNKTYYYKVKPFFYNQNTKKKVYGDYTEPVAVKTGMASTTDMEATQISKSKAKLEWGKVLGAKSYEIYMKKNISGEAYKYVGSTKKLSYTVKNLAADTSYLFQVRAVKKSGSIKSEYLLMADSVDTGLHAPYNLRVTKRTVSTKGSTMTIKSTIKWDAVYGASKYRVEAYDSEKRTWKTVKNIKKNTTTSYTLTNTKKKDGSWKYTEVRVVAIKGDEENYGYVNDIENLATATGVKVKYASATTATVSWKKVAGASHYRIMRTAPNGKGIEIGYTTKTSVKDTCMTPGVNYTYIVTAYNETYDVNSGYSYTYSEDEIPTNQAIYKHKVAAPKISKVSNSASKKATVKWGKVTGATKYIVYRATSEKGTYKKVKTVTGTSFTDSKLTKGKKYFYKIVAVTTNDAGITVESAKSAAKSVKIKK